MTARYTMQVCLLIASACASPAEEPKPKAEAAVLVPSDASTGDSNPARPEPGNRHDPRNPDGSFKYTNRLARESSPYLRQHAHNPVDWHPWGTEAFALAARLKRPVFLSIGYSTCHWCHVMERESFASESVARLLNEKFVCIKVDREERPDVDAVYMAAVQGFLKGGGGWPLTVFLTPERKPFFGLTYLPPEDRDGRTGLKSLLKLVDETWSDPAKRAQLTDSADAVTESLRRAGQRTALLSGKLDEDTHSKAADEYLARFDDRHGGFRAGAGRYAPKFPRTSVYSFLLTRHARTADPSKSDPALLKVVTRSLTAMLYGGIYDQLGGGFHRYSTDREWLVPHFEKMLYDQALITRTYLEAYQVTGRPEYARAVRETFDYVLREMTHTDGGFYAAEDADSDGVEGKFYVWTAEDIDAVLGGGEGTAFRRFYGVGGKPNFAEAGGSILHILAPELATAADVDAAVERFAAARARLLAVRAKRVRPHLDDKISSGWNGLMIGSLAFGSAVLGEPRYLAAANRAADFVLGKLRRSDGRLLVTWRDGQPGPLAVLDDYAYLANGLLDLYEATGAPTRLGQALELLESAHLLFAEPKLGGYQLTGRDAEPLIAPTREIYDGALPSGNAVLAMALLRAAQITGRDELASRAVGIFKTFAGEVAETPTGHPALLLAHAFHVGPTLEIVLAGEPDNAELLAMRKVVFRRFLPNRVVLTRPADGPSAEPLLTLVPWVKSQPPIAGKPTAYVCRDRSCQRPVHTSAELDKIITAALAR